MCNFNCRTIPDVIAIAVSQAIHVPTMDASVVFEFHKPVTGIPKGQCSGKKKKKVTWIFKKKRISVRTNSHTMFVCSAHKGKLHFVLQESWWCCRHRYTGSPSRAIQMGRRIFFPTRKISDQSTSPRELWWGFWDCYAHITSGILTSSRWQDAGLRSSVVKYCVKNKKQNLVYLILNCMKLFATAR